MPLGSCPRGRQKSNFDSIQKRHRSPSERISKHGIRQGSRQGSVDGSNVIQVFSRTAQKWGIGEVVEVLEDDMICVLYSVGEYTFRKVLHMNSQHLIAPSTLLHMKQDATNTIHSHGSPTRSALAMPVGQGMRNRDLPARYEGSPEKYYIEMDYIWELLENESVILVKGSWLLERSRAIPFEPLPCRQDLPCEAMVDIKSLREGPYRIMAEEGYYGIVALSHCWLTKDHPDPEGLLLKEIVPVIQERLRLHKNDGAIFLAWCSLYQPYHCKTRGSYRRLEGSHLTEAQKAAHRAALEHMDIWYTHKNIGVWLLTSYFDGQGAPYDERGWTSWEYRVASLISDRKCVIDLASWDPSQDWDWGCPGFRRPLDPIEFAEEIKLKNFTCGSTDLPLIINNYQRNFANALGCCEELSLPHLEWSTEDLACFFGMLKHYSGLKSLHLAHNQMDDSLIRDLGDGLGHCRNLISVKLDSCNIGDIGVSALSTSLMTRGVCLKHLDLADNKIGHVGAFALGDFCVHGSRLEILQLRKNLIGDLGASALGDALVHCGKHLGKLTLGGNQIRHAGISALAKGLACCSALEHLAFLSGTQTCGTTTLEMLELSHLAMLLSFVAVSFLRFSWIRMRLAMQEHLHLQMVLCTADA